MTTIKEHKHEKENEEEQYTEEISEDELHHLMRNVGHHTTKYKTLIETVSTFVKKNGCVKPCQIFLCNPQNGQRGKITDHDLKNTADLILNLNLPMFVHAAYCINLCSLSTKKDITDTTWAINLVKEDLRICQNLNGGGVVVHVGKKMKLSSDDGLNIMYNSILQILPAATQSCPLLLETPAGQGTELCITIDDFTKFYQRFTPEQQKVLKICIDTQHVFAAGYDPFNYLVTFTGTFGIDSVKLIHLNDSQVPQGSKKDRHQSLGQGYIGSEKLIEVIDFANDNNIPMIVE